MIGYIYLTTNLLNDRKYIGKHQSNSYDHTYYGSGKLILQAIKKYGIENFKNEILDTANSLDELNEKEIYYIDKYRKLYGDKLYNIANGGDGGDVFSSMPKEDKEAFLHKMTIINKERCSSDYFKALTSKRMTEKYSDVTEREKQSKKIKEAWSDENLRIEQSIRLKKFYDGKVRNCDFNCKKCIFELNDVYKEFDSVKELKKFLSETYNFNPSNPKLKEILINGSNGIHYVPFFKNKYSELNGMLIYYKK